MHTDEPMNAIHELFQRKLQEQRDIEPNRSTAWVLESDIEQVGKETGLNKEDAVVLALAELRTRWRVIHIQRNHRGEFKGANFSTRGA